MNISNSTATQASVQAAGQTDSPTSSLAMLLLKKSLDLQKQEGDQIVNMIEGKGQVVDLRV